jgi:organic radical activating enzyme
MKVKGHLCEIFSSFQGEGASVRGSCMGRRQIMIRLAGCNLASGAMGTRGCIYCDTPQGKIRTRSVLIEITPGSGKHLHLENPLTVDAVVKHTTALSTRDLHSLSLTGGEPLWQPEFLEDLLGALKERGLRTYLETNGSLPRAAEKVGHLVDFACVDVKDDSSRASSDWEELLRLELESIRVLKELGSEVFAKLVATRETSMGCLETVSGKLSSLKCPLVIQSVTPCEGIVGPDAKQLFAFSETAAKHLQPDQVAVSCQMHKAIGLR